MTTADNRTAPETPTRRTRPSQSEIADMFTDWGHRVSEARVKAGLTQTQLAEVTEVASGTIGRVEAGTLGEPSIQLRMELAGAARRPGRRPVPVHRPLPRRLRQPWAGGSARRLHPAQPLSSEAAPPRSMIGAGRCCGAGACATEVATEWTTFDPTPALDPTGLGVGDVDASGITIGGGGRGLSSAPPG